MATTASATQADSTPQETASSEISIPADRQILSQTPLRDVSRSGIFPKVWSHSTEDRNLTLYGFRRFKTTHLVNLRFLEEEISELDHRIYQAGLSLDDGAMEKKPDRLGLRCSHRDASVPASEDSITDSMVLRLRSLLKDYDDALTSFNKLMAMETFSLIEDEGQSKERNDLHPYEKYKTRLVRADLGTRATHDPFRRGIQKALQRFQYWRTCGQIETDKERGTLSRPSQDAKTVSYQNTALLAGILSRMLVSLMAGAFMVLPLVMISYQTRQRDRLITISVWIIGFSISISATLRASNLTTIGVVAAYAAVLSVFVSND
ncbi:MAG: hypothetical protein Q9184_007428 [Pyrenodesmia sp. 2 TL-2023]